MMHIQHGSFSICPVGVDSYPAVLDVYRQCEDFLALTPTSVATIDMIQLDMNQSQRQRGEYCGVFMPSGNMVGIVDVIRSGFEGRSDRAFIELLIIAQPYRKRGLGAAVVQAVEAEIAKDTTVTAIELAVMVNNPDAIRFWERMGYIIISGALPQPDGTVVWRMRKPIP